MVEKAVQKTKNVIVRNEFEGLISRGNRICRGGAFSRDRQEGWRTVQLGQTGSIGKTIEDRQYSRGAGRQTAGAQAGRKQGRVRQTAGAQAGRQFRNRRHQGKGGSM
jgi:hypothetical protein